MLMIRFLKELYFVGFVFFYRASNKSWSHSINLARGAAGVSFFGWIMLLTISMWVEIFDGRQFLVFDLWKVGIAIFAIYCVNYYVLVIRGHGIRFEREFNNLKKSKQTFLQVSYLVINLISVAFFLYSGHVLQHFFHIVPKSDY
jgi:ABC-type transport system involved in Fe-S cluster assembly fused permease/ATPase subunit